MRHPGQLTTKPQRTEVKNPGGRPTINQSIAVAVSGSFPGFHIRAAVSERSFFSTASKIIATDSSTVKMSVRTSISGDCGGS